MDALQTIRESLNDEGKRFLEMMTGFAKLNALQQLSTIIFIKGMEAQEAIEQDKQQLEKKAC